MEYFDSVQSSDMVVFLNENAHGLLNSLEIFNEEAQVSTSATVIEKMLNKTMDKYKKLDFGEIERSKGDVHQCRFYKNLDESINILCDINAETGNLPGAIIVSEALNNLDSYKNLFVNAFRTKNLMGILLYNTIYDSIMEATAYLIAASVDLSREGTSLKYKASNFSSRNDMLINNLVKFNSEVDNGNVEKFVLKYREVEQTANDADKVKVEAISGETISSVWKFISGIFIKTGADGASLGLSTFGKGGVIVAAVAAFVWLATHIIPIIKSCIYLKFKIQHKISEAAKMQADLIEGNIELMKENEEGSEESVKRQEKWMKFFRKAQDAFALSHEKANRDASNEEKHEEVAELMI